MILLSGPNREIFSGGTAHKSFGTEVGMGRPYRLYMYKKETWR